MRPIHAILLFALLAAILVGALFLVGGDRDSGRIASALPEQPGALAPGTSTPNAALDGALDGASATPSAANVRVGARPETLVPAPNETFRLRGRVLDPDDRPIAGATVYASGANGFRELALDELDPRENPWVKRVEGTTDQGGRFALDPIAQSSVRLAVVAAGYAPLDVERPIAGASGDVGNLKLERGVVLSGRVVDSGGRPVVGAELRRLRPREGGLPPLPFLNERQGPVLAATDASGAFRIDRLASGPWALGITSESHPDKTETGATERPGETVQNLQFVVEDGFDIQGRVNGVPAGIADLWVRAMPRANDSDGSSSGFTALLGARRALVQPDGTFTLRGTRRGIVYRVAARQGGRFAPGGSRSDGVDAKPGDRGVVLQFKAETAIVCQVVDARTDRPITALSVAAGYEWTMPLQEEGKMRAQTEFPEGRVRFASLPAASEGALATLRIESVGYRTHERKDLRLVAGQDNDIGVVRLEPSSVVRVVVLASATGAPIADAHVSLSEITPRGERGMSFAISVGDEDHDEAFPAAGAAQRGKTNARGEVVISSLPGKKGRISVRHSGYALHQSEPFDMPLVGDLDQTVRLVAGGSVVVEVVDARGKPVPGLAIDHRASDGDPSPMLLPTAAQDATDAAGQCAFAHLAAGRHLFRIRESGDGFAMGGGMVVRRAVRMDGADVPEEKGWTEISVAEGETATLRLVAPERGVLAGRVREGGKPLVGASVRLESKDSDALFDLPFLDEGPSAKSNGEGLYSLEKVTAGEYRLVVTHASRAMPWKADVTVREGTNRFDAELPITIVEGRVLGEDKRPIPGARVTAERDDPGDGARREVRMVMIADDDSGPMSFLGGSGASAVTTDAEGRYRLRGITPDVRVRVSVSGKDVQKERSEPFQLSVDETRTGVDFVLKQGGTLDVLCRRATGAGAPGCIVSAHQEDAEDADEGKTQFTGPDGRTRLSGLKPGRWRVTCSAMGSGPGDVERPVPDRVVDVKVGVAQTVTFDVP